MKTLYHSLTRRVCSEENSRWPDDPANATVQNAETPETVDGHRKKKGIRDKKKGIRLQTFMRSLRMITVLFGVLQISPLHMSRRPSVGFKHEEYISDLNTRAPILILAP